MPEKENVTYYQHDAHPYSLVRAENTVYLERFNLDTKKWVHDHDAFYRVYEDDDYHKITQEEALRIVKILEKTDVSSLNGDQIEKLVG